MKLTGCREFTCNDGQCIAMEKRCNQFPNCRDKSDEIGCKMLLLDYGYNKEVPPITIQSLVVESIKAVPVKISLTLLKVVAILEEDHGIELQFQITLEWKENRATYHNLKKKSYLNALSMDDINRLWLPLVVYTNTDQQETTRLGENWEWKTRVSVKREGNGEASEPHMLHESEIFKGKENKLVMVQSYTHKFQCTYQLEKYPFDIQVRGGEVSKRPYFPNLSEKVILQVCSIDMDVDSIDQEMVSLLPKDFTMLQPEDMTLFTITRSALENASSPQNGIRMKVTIKRKIMSELMTTYFPSLLLMMITFATTFFKPFFFEAALSVNLTTMLVMTTIFISKMEGLPPTSTTKMIDYWLILCQLVPFAQVVLLTAMEFLREDELEKEEEDKETKDTLSEDEHGPETKEAWKPPQEKRSKVDFVPMLKVVGKADS